MVEGLLYGEPLNTFTHPYPIQQVDNEEKYNYFTCDRFKNGRKVQERKDK